MIRKPLQTGMRAVAIFEGAKAAVMLLLGFGALSLVHKNVEHIAERFVSFWGLNPDGKFAHIFVEAAAKVTDAHLLLGAGLAALYVIIRTIEAYGLWNERRWAEWFALISTGFYIPFEIYEIFHRVRWYKIAILCSNVAIVLYMIYALRHSAEQDRERELAAAAPGKKS